MVDARRRRPTRRGAVAAEAAAARMAHTGSLPLTSLRSTSEISAPCIKMRGVDDYTFARNGQETHTHTHTHTNFLYCAFVDFATV